MNRTERIYKINELLRAHKVVSFATLLAKVEVSRSTLKRDLKYLRERLNNPITHHDDLGGYRIEPTQGQAGRPHELPGLWFSPTEIHSLLTMQQLLAYTDHRELIMDILQHGTHCEVLGPPSLRRVVGDEVKRMLGKYF
jgi:predicted DNA-binding transcriptional regulator YafY